MQKHAKYHLEYMLLHFTLLYVTLLTSMEGDMLPFLPSSLSFRWAELLQSWRFFLVS
jgi:hypothetical protein